MQFLLDDLEISYDDSTITEFEFGAYTKNKQFLFLFIFREK